MKSFVNRPLLQREGCFLLVEFCGKRPTIHPTAFVDPQARIAGDVVVSEEAVIFYGSVVRGDEERVFIGRGAVVLENCVIEAPSGHPVSIGEYAMVSHGAIVHGAVVGAGALVGIGAIVLDGASIGEEAIVAAGSVVAPGASIPPKTLVMGSPAKPVRKLSDEELAGLRRGVEKVIKKAKVYREALRL